MNENNNENREEQSFDNKKNEYQRPYEPRERHQDDSNREHRPYNSDYRREGNNSYQKRNYNTQAPKRDYSNQGGSYAPKRDYNGQGGGYAPKRDYNGQGSGYAPKRDYNGQGGGYAPKRDYNGQGGGYAPKRDYNGQGSGYAPKRDYNGQGGGYAPKRDYNGQGGGYAPKRDYNGQSGSYAPKRDYNGQGGGYAPKRDYGNRPQQRDLPDNYGNNWNSGKDENRPQQQRNNWNNNRTSNYRPQQQRSNWNADRNTDYPPHRQWNASEEGRNFVETRFDSHQGSNVKFRKPRHKTTDYDPDAKYSLKKRIEYQQDFVDPTQPVRLNKYLANSGICSRREADEYIQAGVISVNGEVVSTLGTKILPTDTVKFHEQPVQSERKVYILLNKPKDCVTTTEDPNARKTVMDIVRNACSERIYPVGRLDRNTTGVLLLTNDGELASKLAHPKFDKRKVYQVTLDRPLTADDFRKVMLGVELEDGVIAADALEYVNIEKKNTVGIEIHSGKNRIVRRIFEKLGYKIKRLDRVTFAGLTKKNLPRGNYRFLSEKEVAFLKMGSF
ncbi:pseudouridine synthase [Bacteroidia bacterium]|nr:pseudouridine synthase [Bacteroidia bacterium]